jgi:UDP-glucose 4-epimerase
MNNILITGGAGFIGSHVAEQLIKNKFRVFIIDNLSTGSKKLINNKATFYKLDINQSKKVRNILISNNIKTIIHLAGKLNVLESENEPDSYYKNNVFGTKSLLKACNNSYVKTFLFSSSCTVYGNKKNFFKENSKKSPISVYGKTKIKCENLIKNYFKGNYCILRYFNVAGSSASKKIGQINANDQLFKKLTSEVLKKKPVFNIYGFDYKTQDGTCIRDYIHINDLTDIHLKVLKKLDRTNKSMIINCGYGRGYSVLQIMREFIKFSKNKNVTINYLQRRNGDVEQAVANVSKLKKHLVWKPKFNYLNKIIKDSILWEKNSKKL